MKTSLLVCVGVVVHLVLCYSVIDIHFQTPIVHDIRPVKLEGLPRAKRLVLIVADGLRPDKLFANGTDGLPLAPFLQHAATCLGRYGISHTRPPTESRPGHVALTAGFYEDPSALFSGWQANPVPFDSIFTHVAGAWGLGSPDVVPIWDGHGQYAWQAYDAAMEDWSANTNLFDLDTWVLNHTHYLLSEPVPAADAARQRLRNALLPAMPSVDGGNASALTNGPAIVFQHLLGLDSHSHAHGGPWSQPYLDNIRTVDEGVAETMRAMEERFPDGSTAYIFTSDHGMTDQASHGDGSPECTQTPYIVWGAGVDPLPETQSKHCQTVPPALASVRRTLWKAASKLSHRRPLVGGLGGEVIHSADGSAHFALGVCAPDDCTRLPWGMLEASRYDIEQAQLAPLMAALLGVPCPTNGVSLLPWELLECGGQSEVMDLFRAQALWANVRSLLAAYDAKAARQKRSSLFFVHHSGLAAIRAQATGDIEAAFAQYDIENVFKTAEALGKDVQQAIVYLQRYDWKLLYATTVCTYAAWIVFLVLELLRPSVGNEDDQRAPRRACVLAQRLLLCSSAVTAILAACIRVPVTYYAYIAVLGMLCASVARNAWIAVLVWQRVRHNAAKTWRTVLSCVIICAMPIAMAAGFHLRSVYALMCVLLGAVALFALPLTRTTLLGASVVVLPGLFTLLPLQKTPSALLLAATCALAAGFAASGFALAQGADCTIPAGTRARRIKPVRNASPVIRVQLALLALAVLCIVLADDWGHAGNEASQRLWRELSTHVPPDVAAAVSLGITALAKPVALLAGMSTVQACSWLCFLSAPIAPLYAPDTFFARMASTILGLFTSFVMLSISWEALFLLCLDVAMLAGVAYDCFCAPPSSTQNGPANLMACKMEPAIGKFVDLTQDDDADSDAQSPNPASSCHGPIARPVLDGGNAVDMSDAWRALALLFCINLAFFGTGNFASVASFEPASVFRLVRRFDKLVMGALLMVKIIIPLLSCAVVFTGMLRRRNTPQARACLLVLVLSNIMAVIFFFQVTGDGSWQVIGTSISHFGIMNVEVVIVLVLCAVANRYTGCIKSAPHRYRPCSS